jgi:flagellar basal-body rod modification protein FlgD
MASSVNSLLNTPNAGSTAGSTSSASNSGLGSAAPTEGVFLQLLVSQMQNQDPLNPADSTTFVTQLAQFSELEQVIGIRSDIESIMSTNSSSGTPSTSQPSGSGTSDGQTTTNQATNSTTQS